MAAAEGSNKKMIILKSSDGEEFEVEEVVIMVSQTIRNMIKDNLTENDVLPLDVNSKILSKVMEYCNKHVQIKPMTYAIAGEAGASDIVAPVTPAEDLKNWDADFVRVDRDTLFDVIRAAHYLNIKELLDLTCQTVADMIKGKTPEEMREIFNIKNEYTPEEEENFRRENQWAF